MGHLTSWVEQDWHTLLWPHGTGTTLSMTASMQMVHSLFFCGVGGVGFGFGASDAMRTHMRGVLALC